MAGLILEDILKIFPGREAIRAVDHFNLEIAPGELLVLLGPSGCGKTTLLRLIAGLDQPASGRIRVNGESVEGKPPRARSVGMAFQYPALLPQLSVERNIALGLELRGASRAEASARARELAAIFGVTDLLARLPDGLSGGQQQRVSLARALAPRPSLLLLDEPLANLDPASRAELREAIRAAQQRLGVTTLYVTHDQIEAAAVGDRIALMNRGALQQAGSSAELHGDPASLFVAEFFGPERPNVIAGELQAGRFRPAGSESHLPAGSNRSGKVTCVIRPRSIHPGGPHAARITRVQHTGWSTSLLLEFGGVNLRVELPPSALNTGDRFSFAISPADLLLFDPVTGLRFK